MKKIITIAILAALTGCAGQPVQTPAQIAEQVCPVTQNTVNALLATPNLQQSIVTDLNALHAPLQILCNNASTINTADTLSLINLAFNTVVPIATKVQPQYVADLLALQLIADAFVAANKPLTTPTQTGTAPAVTQ